MRVRITNLQTPLEIIYKQILAFAIDVVVPSVIDTTKTSGVPSLTRYQPTLVMNKDAAK